MEALLLLYADRALFHGGFWCDPQICGNYTAIVIFDKPRWELLLIDWVAGSFILIALPQVRSDA